jgi:murein DD-endopeptidase MepM/ murein hydrolase activator NlpD
MLVVACGASTAQAATPPTKTAPFGLPWAAGTTAVLDAGPHTNNVHECLSGQACNALDFTPATGLVTAAGPGVVQSVPYSCAPGLVVIRQKTGSSYNGWYTGYYHLANIRVHAGQTVSEGQVIASLAQNEAQATPCGGSWSGPHVHFFVKYTTGSLGDPFQNTAPDVDLQDIVIGGWKITKEGYSAYAPQGCMTYLATGEKVCSPSGVVKNYAPPSVNPLTNGMYVTVGSSGPVYEIVGGAPLYVSNWAAVGGAHTVNTITQQQFESLNSVPAPGTIVNAVTSTGKEYGAFVIAGGAPLWISKWSAVGGEPANLQCRPRARSLTPRQPRAPSTALSWSSAARRCGSVTGRRSEASRRCSYESTPTTFRTRPIPPRT